MSAQPIDSVLKAIERKAALVGFTKWGLATFVGLHKNTLQGLGTPAWAPSVSTIRRIQEALIPSVREIREAAVAKGIPLRAKKLAPSAKSDGQTRSKDGVSSKAKQRPVADDNVSTL